jgi:hypothetical protein
MLTVHNDPNAKLEDLFLKTYHGFRLHFSDWQTVIVDLPHGDSHITVEANIANQAFWESRCELLSKRFGDGFIVNGMLPGQIAHHQSSRLCR